MNIDNEKKQLIEKLKAEMVSKMETKPHSNLPYLYSVVGMLLIAIVAVVVIIVLRPDLDFIVVVASVTGIVMPTTLSLMAFMKAQETNEQARNTHIMVNSRLTEWMDAAQKIAFGEGVAEGQDKANKRTDELAATSPATLPASAVVPVEIVSTVGTVPVEIKKSSEEEK